MLETTGNMGQCMSEHRGSKKAKENMGQCKSKDQDFKSYANAVFRCGCCLSASLSTETLKGTWGSTSLREKTLREIMLKKSLAKNGTV
jgi:hypothetical protein